MNSKWERTRKRPEKKRYLNKIPKDGMCLCVDVYIYIC